MCYFTISKIYLALMGPLVKNVIQPIPILIWFRVPAQQLSINFFKDYET